MNKLSLLDLPGWFKYPQKLIFLLEQEDIDFGSWQLLHSKWLTVFDLGLKKRYPDPKVIPFARRVGTDDVACFDISKESAQPIVLIIHDYAAPGWEKRDTFDSFDQWLKSAKLENIELDETDK